MGNKVITTLAVGEYLRWGEQLTLPLIRGYAKLHGWDFILISELTRTTGGYSDYCWDMLEHWYRLLGSYERLFNIPVDCIVKPGARDILPAMPPGVYYGFDEWPFTPDDHDICWEHAMDNWPEEFPRTRDYPRHLYSTGPMLVDQSHRELFAPPPRETTSDMLEMALVNMRLHKHGMAHKDMRPEWFNASNIWFEGQPIPDFLHVMWQPGLLEFGAKEKGVREFLPRMGYANVR